MDNELLDFNAVLFLFVVAYSIHVVFSAMKHGIKGQLVFDRSALFSVVFFIGGVGYLALYGS